MQHLHLIIAVLGLAALVGFVIVRRSRRKGPASGSLQGGGDE